jgi:hypothetical protein
MFRQLCPWGMSIQYSLRKNLREVQILSGRRGEKNVLLLPVIEAVQVAASRCAYSCVLDATLGTQSFSLNFTTNLHFES